MIRTLPIALLALVGAVAEGTEPVHVSGTTMGPIVWNVKVDALPDGLDEDGLQARVQSRLDRVNGLMSTWDPESEISRFNASRETDWFDVSRETMAVVFRASEVSEASGGAFDVTVGPIVNLWSFGEEDVVTRELLPTDETIAAASEHVGWEKIVIRTDPPALKKLDVDLRLNLSAIAKGFAVDEVARELDDLGIEGYLFEVGGELRTKGAKADGKPWKVGIERPVAGLRSVQTALVIGDRALATSGDYRNFFEVEGVRYSHTIDPTTGRPVTHDLASVSVVAETCMDADALATALLVLGPDRGYDLAVEQNLAALLIVRNGDDLVERATPAFETLLAANAENEPAPAMSPLTTYLIAFGVFLVAIAAMAVGVILSNRRITGSCGGLANMKDRDGKSICEACTNPLPSCGGVEEGQARDAELETATAKT